MRKTPLTRKTPMKRGKRPSAKPRPRLRPVSKKRAEEERRYLKTRPAFLLAHPHCERCKHNLATEVHHRAGREGKLLNDARHFMAVDRGCHNWIQKNPNEARDAGWLYEVNQKGEIQRR